MTNHSKICLDQNELDIILTFEKELEQIFLTDTNIIILGSTDNLIRITIEIDSNFILLEMMSLLKMQKENMNYKSILSKTILRFKNAFYLLNKSLNSNVNIEELSIYLKKTSIVISSIDRNSIIEEIEDIVFAIIKHHQHFSTLMGIAPNEIHIPVIEDPVTKKLFDKEIATVPSLYQSAFLQFWGIYFDSHDQPFIYSLNRTSILPGDLDLSFD